MKEKITYLMRSEQLTTTRLAEILEIQPSAVSHLVSGRNKPGYDLLQKILRRFPRINPDWLLLDKGDPYRVDFETEQNDELNEAALPLGASLLSSKDDGSISGSNSQGNTIPINIRESNTLNRGSKNPIFVVVFYDDGSCENFSMK